MGMNWAEARDGGEAGRWVYDLGGDGWARSWGHPQREVQVNSDILLRPIPPPAGPCCCMSVAGPSHSGSGELLALPVLRFALLLGIHWRPPLSSFLNTTCGFSSKRDSQLWPGLFKSKLSSKIIPIFEVLAMVWKWKVEAEIWKGRGGRTRKSLGICALIQLHSGEIHSLCTRGMCLIHTPSLWCRNYHPGFTDNWGSKSLNDLSKIALHEGLK